MIGGDDLVARGERRGGQRDRTRGGGVRREHEAVVRCADERGERGTGAIELGLPIEHEKPHRGGLDTGVDRGGRIRDCARAAPVGAVVEVDHGGSRAQSARPEAEREDGHTARL